jgi:hypothetical protein
VVGDGAAAPASPAEPICVVTRITFGKWRSLPAAILRFRRLRRLGRSTIPGFLGAHLRIGRKATLMFISLWRDELALLQFTTLEAHVQAVRWTIRKEGQIWSGVFRLTGTSSMSKPWIGTIRQWEPLTRPQAEQVAADES